MKRCSMCYKRGDVLIRQGTVFCKDCLKEVLSYTDDFKQVDDSVCCEICYTSNVSELTRKGKLLLCRECAEALNSRGLSESTGMEDVVRLVAKGKGVLSAICKSKEYYRDFLSNPDESNRLFIEGTLSLIDTLETYIALKHKACEVSDEAHKVMLERMEKLAEFSIALADYLVEEEERGSLILP